MSEETDCLKAIYHTFQAIYVLLDDGDRIALKEINITPSQFNLLRHLENLSNGGLTITDLSNRLLCTRSNATRMVQRLEKQGIVQVVKDKVDNRRVRITLTKTGAEQLAAARTVHINSLHKRLGTLDYEKQQQLATLTAEVAARLEINLTEK
ncbi:MAG: MarR family transcriptional regulator [Chloroflexi bacterium]|nr:MarR family transcriptional regulator [Chloroflexota bacterium]